MEDQKNITALISGRDLLSLLRILHRAFTMASRMRVSPLPPLKVSTVAGIVGLTGIVGIFLFKDYLDLPAEFLAMLGFGVGLSSGATLLTPHLSLVSIYNDIRSAMRATQHAGMDGNYAAMQQSSLPVLPSCSS
ncbi:MAG: hypothetical protein KJN87_07055 [Desulfofustis sp.]|nr:hypothetical protein [Desulfofustis sp.]